MIWIDIHQFRATFDKFRVIVVFVLVIVLVGFVLGIMRIVVVNASLEESLMGRRRGGHMLEGAGGTGHGQLAGQLVLLLEMKLLLLD